MYEISELKLPVDHPETEPAASAAKALGVRPGDLQGIEVIRRAIDARHGTVLLNYTLHVTLAGKRPASGRRRAVAGGVRIREVGPAEPDRLPGIDVKPPRPALPPVVVGMGPCGLFCALLLARAGWNPIVLERGKAAGPRARDVTGFWRRGAELNPDSNVQFGEGGAGTFSDGKLYTRIRDREGRIPWILRELVRAGAPPEILVNARPHIGTDRLITVVRSIRQEILTLGGTVRFESPVEDLLQDPDGRVRGVRLRGGEEIPASAVVLAPGHSARTVFEMLHRRAIALEAKPISIGVRIEHPQTMIDRMLYGKWAGHAKLGSAPYRFVHHTRDGRTAYSFCMCPGGLVVGAASEPGGVVTNGMSSYARAEANANAGFMVDVSPEQYGGENPLAGVAFQRHWEQRAFAAGGGGFRAPIQTVEGFLNGTVSAVPGSVLPSYLPGTTPADLRECLPADVAQILAHAIPAIDRRLPGFAMPHAILTGVETRSSSPVRILRDPDTLESVTAPGLFPAGEGAGYAGGILSAAVDGMRVAARLLEAPP